MSKPITKSKTFWVNALVVVAAGLASMIDTSIIQENPQLIAYGAMILGIVNVFLRMITKESIR